MHRAYGSRTRDPSSAGGEHASGYRKRVLRGSAEAYELLKESAMGPRRRRTRFRIQKTQFFLSGRGFRVAERGLWPLTVHLLTPINSLPYLTTKKCYKSRGNCEQKDFFAAYSIIIAPLLQKPRKNPLFLAHNCTNSDLIFSVDVLVYKYLIYGGKSHGF